MTRRTTQFREQQTPSLRLSERMITRQRWIASSQDSLGK
jgi:hypothetical protein